MSQAIADPYFILSQRKAIARERIWRLRTEHASRMRQRYHAARRIRWAALWAAVSLAFGYVACCYTIV